MRIALACPYAWDVPGGVQLHVRQLSRRLLERGHHVLVLTPARERPEEPHVVAVGRPVPIPFNGSVAPIAPALRSARRVAEALEGFRPDVVHVHEPLAPSTGMFAARWGRAPVVATFHAYAERALLYSAAAPLLRRVWRRLDLRVAVSEAARRFVRRRFPEGDVRVIPNGVEVEPFARAVPAEVPEGRRVLFVGRLQPRKGFPVLVDAFGLLAATHPDALLVVAGDGRERTMVRRLPRPARERVLMLGAVPNDVLPGYHAAADVFCSPATGGESFGIVLVEAMAAGLPVVASDIPGYREVVRHEREGLLVPPGDAGEVAAALRRVLDDPDLAAGLGEAGRRRAERYSWETVTREIEACYEEAAGGA